MFMGIKNIRSWTLALPVSLSWYSCKRNAVLTISAPNLNYWFYDNRSIVQNSIIYFLQITE